MKRFGIMTLVAGVLLLVTVTWINANEPSPRTLYANEETQKEVDDVLRKIEDTDFTQQIVEALIEKGYHPNGQLAGQIYSMDEKELLIMMKGLNGKSDEVKDDIQAIINSVAESYHLGVFKVTIIEE